MSSHSLAFSKTDLTDSCLSSLSLKKSKRSYRIEPSADQTFKDTSFDALRNQKKQTEKKMKAAVSIQKYVRGFLVRKKLNVAAKPNLKTPREVFFSQISRLSVNQLDSFLFRENTQMYTFSNEFACFDSMNISQFMDYDLPQRLTRDTPVFMFSKEQLVLRVFELMREISKQGETLVKELEDKDDLTLSNQHLQKMIQGLLGNINKAIR